MELCIAPNIPLQWLTRALCTLPFTTWYAMHSPSLSSRPSLPFPSCPAVQRSQPGQCIQVSGVVCPRQGDGSGGTLEELREGAGKQELFKKWQGGMEGGRNRGAYADSTVVKRKLSNVPMEQF